MTRGWGRPIRRPWRKRARDLGLELVGRAYASAFVRAVVRPVFETRVPNRWIFLVGCYNSGTTLTRELLALHPHVRSIPKEGVRYTSVLKRPEDLGWNRMWIRCEEYVSLPAVPDAESARRLRKDWSPWVRSDRAFLEKSVANVTRMEWLDLNFDDAYFIGVIRNGYAAAEGIRRRATPTGNAAKILGGDSYPVEMAGQQWVRANERLLEAADRVGRFHMLRYEDLVRDPAASLSSAWRFLDLEPMDVRVTDGAVRLGGREFRISNRNDESWSRLSEIDRASLADIIGPMMDRLGYGSTLRQRDSGARE